jgi:hypothetical protein
MVGRSLTMHYICTVPHLCSCFYRIPRLPTGISMTTRNYANCEAFAEAEVKLLYSWSSATSDQVWQVPNSTIQTGI